VVVDVMEGYTNFPKDSFSQHIATFFPLGIDLLGRELNPEVRHALQSLLRRVGEVKLGVTSETQLDTTNNK
jgi:brefeldin A-inhibited guanine nucleotide-exchange protein